MLARPRLVSGLAPVLFSAPLALGCGKKINADEASAVLDAAWLLTADAQAQVDAAAAGEGVEGLTVTEEGEGNEINGVLGQGDGWFGRMLVDAFVETDGESGLWDMELGLSGVAVGPNTLDGDLTITVDKEANPNTVAFTQSYGILGTVTTEGAAKGEASISVTFTIESDAGGVVTCSGRGEVDGFEVVSCAGQTITVVTEGEDAADTGA